MRSVLTPLLLILLCTCARAQELPPIVAYETETYAAGSQSWMLSQDENGYLFAANNEGLLEFNGQQWTLHPAPDETIIRSVRAHGDRIYTGTYMDFGYWSRTATGSLTYRSLTGPMRNRILNDEQFWNIIVHEEYVVFQSLQQLFLYDPENGDVRRITPPGGIGKLFSNRRGLFFTSAENGLYRLTGGKMAAVFGTDGPASPVAHLWVEDGRLLLQTISSGCYALDDGRLIRQNRHAFLDGKRIYSAVSRRGGGLVFGTISHGLYIVDPKGKLRYQLDQTDGLTNNTILSLFEDDRNNLWAGTDNGISYVNLSSPFRKFTDNSGRLGTVHNSLVLDGRLYLGSNQGLFVKRFRSDEPLQLIDGTRGQVWSLFVYDGTLFAGHDRGTFVVTGERAQRLDGTSGTWTFSPLPDRPDLLLQGHYSGLSVLQRTSSGQWTLRNQVPDFGYSARFLAVRPTSGGEVEVYVSHEYRGVFGLRLSSSLTERTAYREYESPPKSPNAGVATFRDRIYFYSREGMFVLENFDTGFVLAGSLNEALIPREYTSGKMTATANRLWFFTGESISFFHRGALSGKLQRQTVPVTAELVNAKSGYENITPIGGDSLLIGTADGYLVLALSAVPLHQHELFLSSATSRERDGPARPLPLTEGGDIPFLANNLHFSLAVPAYGKYFNPLFQYRIRGLQEAWSEWSTASEIEAPNLPYGSYVLEARSLLGRRASENAIAFPFRILRPWYNSYLAYGLYVLGGALLIYLLHRSYTGYYRRKQTLLRAENERLIAARERETELELTRINNQRLEEEIANKNREMAISTMSLVKKNELLQQIKDNLLADQEPKKNIREVVRTIDQNINEEETWNLFRDAFESADREFFRKIKDRHPELTPNDLKLCAYLRLNLSSKEIAPMLNISVRSVEVKRYRLRKKMELARETGLVDYILNL